MYYLYVGGGQSRCGSLRAEENAGWYGARIKTDIR
jgi:hypothetical protein